jgi:hypothetical protein
MHERSTFLMWQSATQTVLSAVLTISASPLAGAIGPQNWYYLGAGLAAVTLIFSIFLVPESRYARSLMAYGQSPDFGDGEPPDSRMMTAPPVRISERPALDTTLFQARTLRSDMRVFVGSPDWAEGWFGFIVRLSRLRDHQFRSCLNLLSAYISNPAFSQRPLGILSQRPYHVSIRINSQRLSVTDHMLVGSISQLEPLTAK